MWPFSKKLEDVLYKTKTVRVHGVKFSIKKIDPADHLEGNKVMLQMYDTYQVQRVKRSPQDADKDMQKIRDHYRDVFLCAVVEPKLSRKDGDPGLPVAHLFTEWNLAHELYQAIMAYTYGVKKKHIASSVASSST